MKMKKLMSGILAATILITSASVSTFADEVETTEATEEVSIEEETEETESIESVEATEETESTEEVTEESLAEETESVEEATEESLAEETEETEEVEIIETEETESTEEVIEETEEAIEETEEATEETESTEDFIAADFSTEVSLVDEAEEASTFSAIEVTDNTKAVDEYHPGWIDDTHFWYGESENDMCQLTVVKGTCTPNVPFDAVYSEGDQAVAYKFTLTQPGVVSASVLSEHAAYDSNGMAYTNVPAVCGTNCIAIQTCLETGNQFLEAGTYYFIPDRDYDKNGVTKYEYAPAETLKVVLNYRPCSSDRVLDGRPSGDYLPIIDMTGTHYEGTFLYGRDSFLIDTNVSVESAVILTIGSHSDKFTFYAANAGSDLSKLHIYAGGNTDATNDNHKGNDFLGANTEAPYVAIEADLPRGEKVTYSIDIVPITNHLHNVVLTPNGDGTYDVSWSVDGGMDRIEVNGQALKGNATSVKVAPSKFNKVRITLYKTAFGKEIMMNNLGYCCDELDVLEVPSFCVASTKTTSITFDVCSDSKFEVWRSEKKDGDYTKVATLKSSVDSWTNKELKDDKTYYYKVRACSTADKLSFKDYDPKGGCCDADLESSEATRKSVTIYSDFSKPIKVTTKAKSLSTPKAYAKNNKFCFDKVSSAKSYQVQYKLGAKGEWKNSGDKFTKACTNGYRKTSKPGVYYYRVRATKTTSTGDTIKSSWSKSIKITIKPKSTESLKATSKKSKQVQLSWKSVKDVDGYEIYFSTKKDGKFYKVATTSSNKKTFNGKVTYKVDGKSKTVSLKGGKTYYFKVRAYKESKGSDTLKGGYSSVKSIKVKK
ncbi:MAG: hypothetical protein ACI4A3_02040 [Lachnospiraceae bacterium]